MYNWLKKWLNKGLDMAVILWIVGTFIAIVFIYLEIKKY
jgi:hypothetical protein